jgi:hypothetical protein
MARVRKLIEDPYIVQTIDQNIAEGHKRGAIFIGK